MSNDEGAGTSVRWDRVKNRTRAAGEDASPNRSVASPRRGNRKASKPRLRQFSCDDNTHEVHKGHRPHPQHGPHPAEEVEQVTEEIPEEEEVPANEEDSASVASDESMTLRDRQDAINSAHPFGIRIWKPALYQKSRSVERNADEDIHYVAGSSISISVLIGNLLWSIIFGIVLFTVCMVASVSVIVLGGFSKTAMRYGSQLYNLAWFLLMPVGKYVQLVHNENYREEDEGQGRPMAEYVEWNNSHLDAENQNSHLFFAPRNRRFSEINRERHRIFGRGEWTVARAVYYVWYYLALLPVLLPVSFICWLGVIGVPMARIIVHLLYHLRVHPLALRIRSTSDFTSEEANNHDRYSIILCTYRAFGLKYYKYTYRGTNIIVINMLALVFVVIADFFIFNLLSEGVRFFMSLVSIVPLAYFIGQAVASISAQSSMGMGATLNAFFSSIVEVYLYLVALREGKGELVEGAVIGSIMAGVLVMPGLSMCAGAINRKTQRFNPLSTGVTSTMLLFGVVGILSPTLFYSIYGPVHVVCDYSSCAAPVGCRCLQEKVPLQAGEPMYEKIILPLSIFCCIALFLSYVAGLFFTLRTHAAMIWESGTIDEGDVAGHDAPNWGQTTSYVILITATYLYAAVAEILVDSTDFVLKHVSISPHMLGITIFALVPNTAEFLNAISFAIMGNVALSLEIGSAYALQVCMIQVPAVVLASLAYIGHAEGKPLRNYVFTMLLSQWDVWVAVICSLLFMYVHMEGKSNYFKGSVLLLTYAVLISGYYLSDVAQTVTPFPMTMDFGASQTGIPQVSQPLALVHQSS